jgi:hypothetical protein
MNSETAWDQVRTAVGRFPQRSASAVCRSASVPTGVLDSRAGIVSFESGSCHSLLVRSEIRYDIKYFKPCRHDTNMRVMPCLESRHGELYGLARILSRAWAGTVRKWHVDTSTTIQYNFLAFTILLLISFLNRL